MTYNKEMVQQLIQNVEILVEKNAVQELFLPEVTPGFYSHIFLVPKKNSQKLRMIHNLADFNRLFLEPPPHFQMPTLCLLRTRIRPGDFLISLDLQDAYLHVPIFPPHHRYLRFHLEGRHFQWKVLPFGISSAPWLFTRIMKPVAAYLHHRRVNFDSYIDDCLLNHQDSNLLIAHRDFTIRLFRQLGWLLNWEKSDLMPSRHLQFLGGLFLTDRGLIKVPPDRWAKMQSQVSQALQGPLFLRQWQSLLGILTSSQDLTARGRLQLRPLQRFLYPYLLQDQTATPVRLPDHLRPFLLWWTRESNVLEGVSLTEPTPTRHLFVDASLQGWGAHLGDQTVSGVWDSQMKTWHINNLEFEAVLLAVQH